MTDYADLVKRLRTTNCASGLCPRLMHDAATAIEQLGTERVRMELDIEVMQAALDHLANATIGPAVLANICEAGRHEIMARRDFADEARKNTHAWREADAATDAAFPQGLPK